MCRLVALLLSILIALVMSSKRRGRPPKEHYASVLPPFIAYDTSTAISNYSELTGESKVICLVCAIKEGNVRSYKVRSMIQRACICHSKDVVEAAKAGAGSSGRGNHRAQRLLNSIYQGKSSFDPHSSFRVSADHSRDLWNDEFSHVA
jgi:hypothetical protein